MTEKNIKKPNKDVVPEETDTRTSAKAPAEEEPELNVKAGLMYVKDDELDYANKLIELGIVKDIHYVSDKTQPHAGEFCIDVNIQNFCSVAKTHTLESLAKGDGTKGSHLYVTREYMVGKCNNPKCGKAVCPLRLAAYILYLQRKGGLEQALEERAKAIEADWPRSVFGDYTFDWPGIRTDVLRAMRREDYVLAEKIREKHMASVSTNPTGITPSATINVFCPYAKPRADKNRREETDNLLKLRNIAAVQKAVRSPSMDAARVDTCVRANVPLDSDPIVDKAVLERCNCSAPVCPFVLAAVLDYLEHSSEANKKRYNNLKRYFNGKDFKEPAYFVFSNELKFNFSEEERQRIMRPLQTVNSTVLNLALFLVDKNLVDVTSEPIPTKTPKGEPTQAIAITTWAKQKELIQAKTYEEVKNIILSTKDESPHATTVMWGQPPVINAAMTFGEQVLAAAFAVIVSRKSSGEFVEMLSARDDLAKEFQATAGVTKGLDKIQSLANNQSANSLYCVVQGSRHSGKGDIIRIIANGLSQAGKIKVADPFEITMQQAQELLTNHQTNQGGYDTLGSGYSYRNFEKNVLHVIYEVGQFISDYDHFAKSPMNETRYRAYRHLADVLGSYEPDTYVIIVGEEAEIKDFLNMDPRYKFMYGQNIIDIKDLTDEGVYEAYVGYLSEELLSQVEDREKFKTEVLEWLAVNKRFLPFGGVETASYLANFSNIAGAPVLPESVYDSKETQEQLNAIVGMNHIKSQIKEFEKYVTYMSRAKAHGVKLDRGNMHMLFVGNPGTGKTTIARIIASILYEIGVISKNKLVEVSRKDLVAEYVGQSAPKTQDAIAKATGGVLFIDEAYSLCENQNDVFGKEVIATLIKAMEDKKEELVVIFAGYKKEMQEFMKMNSGIESRIGYTFQFDDYSPDELVEILTRMGTKQGIIFDPDALAASRKLFKTMSGKRNFGNGRFVEKFFQMAVVHHASNDSREGWKVNVIDVEDIPTAAEMTSRTVGTKTEGIESMIGMEDLKKQVKKFEDQARFEKLASSAGIELTPSAHHMLFMGNPGTGKSTVARILANILYENNVIPTDRLVEVGPSDLIGEYLGQTAPKTQDVIDRAVGGVLFIDEAYQLYQGSTADSYGKEAITAVIRAMEEHRDSLVVIFSGYEEAMRTFIASNPGLQSRIGHTFIFEDYSAEELYQIFEQKLSKMGMTVAPEIKQKVVDIMQYFCNVPNFGNGRFVERVIAVTMENHAQNCTEESSPEEIRTITGRDIPSIETMIDSLPDKERMIRPDEIDDGQYARTAYHELGHAFLSKIFFPKTEVERITVFAEGSGALGYVRHKRFGGYTRTGSELRDDICIAMGGIAAEKVFLGEYASGGTSDLEKATALAKNMIARYGMAEDGFIQRELNDEEVVNGADRIISKEFDRATSILGANRDLLEQAKEELLKAEDRTISEERLVWYVEQAVKPEDKSNTQPIAQ